METAKVDCPRCKGYVLIPVLTQEDRTIIAAELRQSNSTVYRIKQMHERAGFDIADSKRFVTHFSTIRGVCARCSRPLLGNADSLGHTFCPHCKSLNLDW